ncbi:hypothetical protein F4860DRAFT_282444 [Xylaria cubensis]|nr:hypothetical protein F4860DRAFT_282444 [Xylaria cubensis]
MPMSGGCSCSASSVSCRGLQTKSTLALPNTQKRAPSSQDRVAAHLEKTGREGGKHGPGQDSSSVNANCRGTICFTATGGAGCRGSLGQSLDPWMGCAWVCSSSGTQPCPCPNLDLDPIIASGLSHQPSQAGHFICDGQHLTDARCPPPGTSRPGHLHPLVETPNACPSLGSRCALNIDHQSLCIRSGTSHIHSQCLISAGNAPLPAAEPSGIIIPRRTNALRN